MLSVSNIETLRSVHNLESSISWILNWSSEVPCFSDFTMRPQGSCRGSSGVWGRISRVICQHLFTLISVRMFELRNSGLKSLKPVKWWLSDLPKFLTHIFCGSSVCGTGEALSPQTRLLRTHPPWNTPRWGRLVASEAEFLNFPLSCWSVNN